MTCDKAVTWHYLTLTQRKSMTCDKAVTRHYHPDISVPKENQWRVTRQLHGIITRTFQYPKKINDVWQGTYTALSNTYPKKINDVWQGSYTALSPGHFSTQRKSMTCEKSLTRLTLYSVTTPRVDIELSTLLVLLDTDLHR